MLRNDASIQFAVEGAAILGSLARGTVCIMSLPFVRGIIEPRNGMPREQLRTRTALLIVDLSILVVSLLKCSLIDEFSGRILL